MVSAIAAFSKSSMALFGAQAGSATTMHESFYSYNLTRPYPYRWFTPVVIFGGIVFTAVFSLLNVAAEGYELSPESSTNPNETVVRRDWLSSWPSFFVGTQSSCDSTVIPLQSRLYTNNTALPYSLERVWRGEDGPEGQSLGSLTYHNQELQMCNVTGVATNIDIETRTAFQMAMLPVGGFVQTEVECFIDSPEGRTYLQLNSLYEPLPSAYRPSRTFVYANETNQANLFWGSFLMRVYWADAMWKFAESNKARDSRWRNGVTTLFREREELDVSEDDIASDDFLRVSCFLNRFAEPDTVASIDFCNDRNNLTALREMDDDVSDIPAPDFWESISIMSKALYFTVLADLGRDDDTMPNILSRAPLLEDLARDLNSTRENLSSSFNWGIASQPDLTFQASDSPDLTVRPAVLASTYLCKMRKPKQPISVFFAVLISDLVLLSALWRLYVWIVDTFWVGKSAKVGLPPAHEYKATADSDVDDGIPLSTRPLVAKTVSLDDVSVSSGLHMR